MASEENSSFKYNPGILCILLHTEYVAFTEHTSRKKIYGNLEILRLIFVRIFGVCLLYLQQYSAVCL